MGRGPAGTYTHPDLGAALAHMRRSAGMTQKQLATAVTEQGEPVSPVYLAQIEQGRKCPSDKKLSALLATLGSSETDLTATLVHTPWRNAGRGMTHARESGALRSTGPVHALSASPAHASAPPVFAMATMSAVAPTSAAGEIAEVGALYASLGRSEQLTAIGMLRGLAARTPGQ